MRVQKYTDIEAFSKRVHSWLLKNESEYNLLLGLIDKIKNGCHGFEEPIFLASIEQDGQVVGCAWRTPPHKLGITRIPMESIPILVDLIASVYTELPGVLGTETEVVQFAECWSQISGCSWALGMRLRIHVLEKVKLPVSSSIGKLRLARNEDLSLLTHWIELFAKEIGLPEADPKRKAEVLIRDAAIFLWEDSHPLSMVGLPGKTPNGVRVGYVFTPIEFRKNGYATNAVAFLSERILKEGSRFCFLYTDLSNPTSNAIYARIGYMPISDVIEANFTRSTVQLTGKME